MAPTPQPVLHHSTYHHTETTNLVFLSSPRPRSFSLWAPDPTLCLSPENILILINYLETMDSTASPRKANLLFYVREFLEAEEEE